MAIKTIWIGDRQIAYNVARLASLRLRGNAPLDENGDDSPIAILTNSTSEVLMTTKFEDAGTGEFKRVSLKGVGQYIASYDALGALKYDVTLLSNGLLLSNASGDTLSVFLDGSNKPFLELTGVAGAHALISLSGATLDFELEGIPTADQLDGKTVWSNAGVLTLSS